MSRRHEHNASRRAAAAVPAHWQQPKRRAPPLALSIDGTQSCSTMMIKWDASGGKAPWNIWITPMGHTPSSFRLAESYLPATAKQWAFTWQVPNFGANQQMLVAVSDSTGASAGVSNLINLGAPQGNCAASQEAALDFVWYPKTANSQPQECGTWPLQWQSDSGNSGIVPPVLVTFLPESGVPETITVPSSDDSLDWNVSSPSGTRLGVVLSDNGKSGTGGVGPLYTVGAASSRKGATCRNTNAHSSPALPNGAQSISAASAQASSAALGAGASTSASASSSSSTATTSTAAAASSSVKGSATAAAAPAASNISASANTTSASSSKTATVGGVVGGIAGAAVLLFLLFWLWRRKRANQALQNQGWTGAAKRPFSAQFVSPWRYSVNNAGGGKAGSLGVGRGGGGGEERGWSLLAGSRGFDDGGAKGSSPYSRSSSENDHDMSAPYGHSTVSLVGASALAPSGSLHHRNHSGSNQHNYGAGADAGVSMGDYALGGESSGQRRERVHSIHSTVPDEALFPPPPPRAALDRPSASGPQSNVRGGGSASHGGNGGIGDSPAASGARWQQDSRDAYGGVGLGRGTIDEDLRVPGGSAMTTAQLQAAARSAPRRSVQASAAAVSPPQNALKLPRKAEPAERINAWDVRNAAKTPISPFSPPSGPVRIGGDGGVRDGSRGGAHDGSRYGNEAPGSSSMMRKRESDAVLDRTLEKIRGARRMPAYAEEEDDDEETYSDVGEAAVVYLRPPASRSQKPTGYLPPPAPAKTSIFDPYTHMDQLYNDPALSQRRKKVAGASGRQPSVGRTKSNGRRGQNAGSEQQGQFDDYSDEEDDSNLPWV